MATVPEFITTSDLVAISKKKLNLWIKNSVKKQNISEAVPYIGEDVNNQKIKTTSKM
jgi:hypothetical protein